LSETGEQETTDASSEDGNPDDFESPEIVDSDEEEVAGRSAAVEPEIISAHDLIIEEWPVPKDITEPSESSESSEDTDAAMSAEADLVESDAQVELRRVIDEFSEEHRLELEDRNELPSRDTTEQESETSLDGGPSTEDSNVGLEMVVSASTATSTVLTSQMFGATDSVESDVEVLDPETESDVEQPLPEGKNSEP
jgi:hypothetical protein